MSKNSSVDEQIHSHSLINIPEKKTSGSKITWYGHGEHRITLNIVLPLV
jgi:hypothetical protein